MHERYITILAKKYRHETIVTLESLLSSSDQCPAIRIILILIAGIIVVFLLKHPQSFKVHHAIGRSTRKISSSLVRFVGVEAITHIPELEHHNVHSSTCAMQLVVIAHLHELLRRAQVPHDCGEDGLHVGGLE